MNTYGNPNITNFDAFIDNEVSKETCLVPKSEYAFIKISRPSNIGTAEHYALVNLETHELLSIDGDLYDELEYSSYEEIIEMITDDYSF